MKTSSTRRSAIAAAAAVLAALFTSGSMTAAFAQDIKQRTVKFATQNPKGHPLVTGFAET